MFSSAKLFEYCEPSPNRAVVLASSAKNDTLSDENSIRVSISFHNNFTIALCSELFSVSLDISAELSRKGNHDLLSTEYIHDSQENIVDMKLLNLTG